jgi:hypothetical protein
MALCEIEVRTLFRVRARIRVAALLASFLHRCINALCAHVV